MYESELKQQGIQVIGIAQFRTTREDTQEFIDNESLSFPNIYDGSATLANAYGVDGVPSYVFIDGQGRVAASSTGAKGTDYLTSVLGSLMTENER